MPDTSTPFHLAYGVAAVIYGGYSVFLWRRWRTVRTRRAAKNPPSRERGA